MGNFDRNKRSDRGDRGDRGGFGQGGFKGRSFGGDRGGKSFGGRDFGGPPGRPMMHQATCNECGKSCEVPFRPSGSRPIFCSNCFEKQGGPRGGEKSYAKPRFEDKRMPSFEKSGPDNSRELEQLKKQVELVNSKLDTILDMLEDCTIDEDEMLEEEIVVPVVKEKKEKAPAKKAKEVKEKKEAKPKKKKA